VLQHEIDECASAATGLLAAHQPWEALSQWVGRFTELVGTKRGLAVALHSGDPAFNDLPRYITDVLEPAAGQLLDAATTSGAIHAEITARHLLLTVALMCQPVPGEDLQFNDRMIRIFVEGLRRPLPSAVDRAD
jgi:hypothetical protein